ncbi:hypothetical protein HK102_013477 [Quaeritorhiza haematococci]|nr:hypothetical protein HK102_013477 [Quaeritorhiza haematococci]
MQRRDQYKPKHIPSLEDRRRRFLEDLKHRRREKHDFARTLTVVLSDSDDEVEGYSGNNTAESVMKVVSAEGQADCHLEQDSMEVQPTAVDSKPKTKLKKQSPFRNQIMVSEALVDVPSDFETNWIAMLVGLISRRRVSLGI